LKEYNKIKATLKNCWVCPTWFPPIQFHWWEWWWA